MPQTLSSSQDILSAEGEIHQCQTDRNFRELGKNPFVIMQKVMVVKNMMQKMSLRKSLSYVELYPITYGIMPKDSKDSQLIKMCLAPSKELQQKDLHTEQDA